METARAKMAPLTMPVRARGKVTSQKAWRSVAPRTRAASVNERSMPASPAKRRPDGIRHRDDDVAGEQPGETVDQPHLGQEQQQGETGDDRRHDERRQEERDSRLLAGKAARGRWQKAVATPTESDTATDADRQLQAGPEPAQEIVVGKELLETSGARNAGGGRGPR